MQQGCSSVRTYLLPVRLSLQDTQTKCSAWKSFPSAYKESKSEIRISQKNRQIEGRSALLSINENTTFGKKMLYFCPKFVEAIVRPFYLCILSSKNKLVAGSTSRFEIFCVVSFTVKSIVKDTIN